MKDEIELISEVQADQMGIDAGSKMVKKLAAKQIVEVTLPADVIEMIKSQWEHWDNKAPAELRFLCEGETKAKFRVAAYAYRSDTCCA
jgi:uncharacterized protein (DUF4415 family)